MQPKSSLPNDLQQQLADAGKLSPHLVRHSVSQILEGMRDAALDLLGPLKTPVDFFLKAAKVYTDAKKDVLAAVHRIKVQYVSRAMRKTNYTAASELHPIIDELAEETTTANTPAVSAALPADLAEALAPAQQVLQALDVQIATCTQNAALAKEEVQSAAPFDANAALAAQQQSLDALIALVAPAQQEAAPDVQNTATTDGTLQHVGATVRDATTAVLHHGADEAVHMPTDTTVQRSVESGGEVTGEPDPLPRDVRAQIDADVKEIDRLKEDYRHSVINAADKLANTVVSWCKDRCSWKKGEKFKYSSGYKMHQDQPSTLTIPLPNGGTMTVEGMAIDDFHTLLDGNITMHVPVLEAGKTVQRAVAVRRIDGIWYFYVGDDSVPSKLIRYPNNMWDGDPNTLAYSDVLFGVNRQIPEAAARSVITQGATKPIAPPQQAAPIAIDRPLI